MSALITPSVLRWARESLGYDLPDIVEKLDRKTVTVETLSDWEDGKSLPSYPQLKALAKIYKRPIALFFFPAPPEEKNIKENFRAEYVENLPPEMCFLIRKAQVRQMELEELHETQQLDIQINREAYADNDPKKLAMQMREKIGISIQEQQAWNNADIALKHWRNAVEKLGVWIFKASFTDENYSGFCLNHQHFPIMYIHNGDAKQRQIFTLFHELGHLLKGSNAIDFRDTAEKFSSVSHRPEEIFCNAFAGEFLIPSSEGIGEGSYPGDDGILKLAKTYNVSFEVVLRKYRDKKTITQSDYEEIKARKKSDKKQYPNDGGGNYYFTQIAYLGDKYLNLVLQHYHRGSIDKYQLSEYLGVKAEKIPTLEEHIT